MPVKIHYLGHSGVLLSDGKYTVAIDPYLTDNPVAKQDAKDIRCDFIVATHGHDDHASDIPAIARNNKAPVYAAYELSEMLGKKGVAKAEAMNPGGKVTTPFGYVALTPAIHSSSFNGEYAGMPCGAVVHIGGVSVYHTGDTALFSDMRLIGEIYEVKVALIAAGDRFTMGPELAARAAEFIRPKVAIPIHWGTWPMLAQFEDLSRMQPQGVPVKVLKSGEEFTF